MAVAVADLDGDTVPDLVIANFKSDEVRVLPGNGDGSFQSALSCLPVASSAAAAAFDCGFFDQPHMLRDFRTLAGAPPSVILEEAGALAAHLQSGERLSEYFRAE